ncbi:MAG TPA: FAD/NAD(P)-binding protein [Steroidobacteraceae bacterium]|nr:FAD/NAD(P)-binding protein [Steroidobacteraceae bacterium]
MQRSSQGAAAAARFTESSVADRGRHVAIIGAGFSGTALAIQLLRVASSTPLKITLIDPREEIGAGIAYAARDYPYPLNVSAGQMSLDTSRPHDFLDHVNAQGIHAAAGDFLPRQVYGEYLRARFHAARATAPAHVSCTHHRASAMQLRRAGSQPGWELWLDDGKALRADDVVLALGNPPPACPSALEPIAASHRYVRDPWSITAPSGDEIQSVLLLGSGLTMIDAALRLAALRPRVRHIHVLSRHGWLPQSQATTPRPTRLPKVREALDAARGSVLELSRALRVQAREVEAAGGDWREVFTLARPEIASQWHALDATQRTRFQRHARALWDVHRHRVPAGPLAAVHSLSRRGVLEVHAGRILEANAADDAVEVIWRPRGSQRTRAWLVDRVVNCTGPGRVSQHADPLVQSLLSNGLMRTDALDVGIDVDHDGRVIARDGRAIERLYYIGPWLRARDWEATAVPELRQQALALAELLARESPGAVKGAS